MAKKYKNALLWRISPPSKNVPDSFLFGTMHVRDARAFAWLGLAEQHLRECEVFATEYDFSEMDPVALASTMKLPDGKTLPELLPNAAWKSLKQLCVNHLHLPVEAFSSQHPMAVAAAVSQIFMATDQPFSLDETLWQTAQLAGKSCTGVETFAEQMDIVGKIPMETHLKSLSSLLKNVNRYRRQLKKMSILYQSGDIRKLASVARRDAKGMRRILIYERNALMAKRITKISSEKSLFCAVGAGHLAGEKGLLRLLKKSGFKVKPVRFA